VRKVITVSLNGNAFQLDDDAYAALSAYLDEAARALGANPDRAEIISDLEQAIADKCAGYLNPHKSVITLAEIEKVIEQMGAVDADPAPGAQTSAGSSAGSQPGAAASPRRLYQISEGAIVSGICNGYAAYSGIDVTWIRAIFVLLIFVTGGAALVAYLVLMFIIPYANTSEEHAAAHGLPFNARMLVENAKRHYSKITSSPEWQKEKDSMRNEWRRTRAQWRLERRRARQEWRHYRRYGRPFGGYSAPTPGAAAAATMPPPPAPYLVHVITGSMVALLGLIGAVIGISMCLAIFSLITSGGILGWQWPHDLPLWLGLVAVFIVWNAIAWPLRAARHSIYWHTGGYGAPWHSAFDVIVTVLVLIVVASWSLHHIPQIRDFIHDLPRLWQHDTWSNTTARVIVRACLTVKDLALWLTRQV
jgi:phage shock protein PspC (stress-responsive transcriptional regulator)